MNPLVARCRVLSALLLVLLGVPAHAGERVTIPGTSQPYAAVGDLSGSLTTVSSDALSKLMGLWTEWFAQHYPAVKFHVDTKDSGAAVEALIEGAAPFVPMSRLMTTGELQRFETKYKYQPTAYAVAVDALVLYVHKDNPIEGLTMDQVDGLFLKMPRHGGKPYTHWGQLDVAGDWAEAPITLYGPPATSGTYAFFKEHLLNRGFAVSVQPQMGAFRDDLKEQPSLPAVVQRIEEDRRGIGFGGSELTASTVRILPLAEDEFSPFIEPTVKNVTSRRYPLRRYLYLYVNQPRRKLLPGNKALPPLVREFLLYVHSQEGQAAVLKSGYAPVEDWIVERARKTIK